MYFDATVGLNDYTITLRIDFFWFWKLWYVWESSDQKCYSISPGFFEVEIRRPLTKKEKRQNKKRYDIPQSRH